MKKNTIGIFIAAIALTGVVQSAQAGEKERYLLGGLLGGWILNDVTSRPSHSYDRHTSSVQVRFGSNRCSPVGIERRSPHHSRPSGRHEYRRVKVWISGHYDRVASRCGRVETRWVPGRYETRTEKVWVSYGSSHSQRHGRGR
jgi:hypothetical protein